MTKYTYLLFTLFFLLSCKQKQTSFEKIDFVPKYKFNSEIKHLIHNDTIEKDFMTYALHFSLKGEHKQALDTWDSTPMFKPKVKTFSKVKIDSINRKYMVLSAKDFILNESKKNDIIIVNEYHHNAAHRIFTQSLLQKLFDSGYKNLMLEALSNGTQEDTLLNNRKYPIQSSGYYVKNPQFGNFIRKALEIGFKLYPYETTENIGGEAREKAQANNINKIIKNNPKEKFLIYCGSGHALEGKVPFYGGLALAERLKILTGIDPLTVDQVYFSEKSLPEYRSPLFKSFKVNKPSILIDTFNNPYSYKKGGAWMDIVVFHPNTKYNQNRPNWLFENGRKNVAIPITDLKIDFPIMIFAYKKGEDINTAIPFDINEIQNKTENCNLALEKGNYEIVATNGKESIKFEQNVK